MDRPRRSDCTAGQMDGEAGWWTTCGNIGLPPLARVMGVGRQQHHMVGLRTTLQAVELSQRSQTAVQIVSKLPGPSNGCTIYRFLGKPAMRTRWMAGAAPHKSGDVETNPGPTTLNKRAWICDICYKQIHVRKQLSMRGNMNQHWVHLRCAGIRQEHYTDTWTCHLHRDSRLTTHTPPFKP